MTQFNWTCPHCSRPQIVTDKNWKFVSGHLRLTELDIGQVGIRVRGISCLNEGCKKLTLNLYLLHATDQGYSSEALGEGLKEWQLIPESSAVSQPEFIPEPIREDYYEACRISSLSPKASATLARRCLQGMIRDFCGIAKGTLDGEIKELRNLLDENKAPSGVTFETIESIDHVRSIGNIGAHMEKDINLIVDVEEGEAKALIGLIEMLFSEWYVARHNRRQRLAQIAAIAADKKAQIAEAKADKAKNAIEKQD